MITLEIVILVSVPPGAQCRLALTTTKSAFLCHDTGHAFTFEGCFELALSSPLLLKHVTSQPVWLYAKEDNLASDARLRRSRKTSRGPC